MEENKTEELVHRFRAYLEKSGAEGVQPPEKRLDLFSFYSEITALKNEVRIESKQIKQGFTALQETLVRQEEKRAESAAEQQPITEENNELELQPLLDGLIDLYDRIHASIQAMSAGKKKKKSSWFRRRKQDKNPLSDKEQEIITSMRAGQQMLLSRIIDLLEGHEIIPIDSVKQRFDPHTMRALGTDTLAEVDDGIVSLEIRTGFLHQGKLLRLADVRVNRL